MFVCRETDRDGKMGSKTATALREGETPTKTAANGADVSEIDVASIGHVVGEYTTGKQMQILEGPEAVRRNVPMYIGGTDSKGMHHLFKEVSDNSVDEA